MKNKPDTSEIPFKLFATNPSKKIGEILTKEFYNLVNFKNKQCFQNLIESSFFEESEFFDYFQSNYNRDISTWSNIFSFESLEKSFSILETFNFGEEKRIKNINVTPKSSGFSIGSSFWIISSQNHSFETFCLCLNSSIFKNNHSTLLDPQISQYNTVIFGEDNFAQKYDNTNLIPYEGQFVKLLNTIKDLLSDNVCILLPVRNPIFLLNFLDIISNELNTIKIISICESFENIIKLSNSFVDYCNPILQKKVFNRNPELPFNSFEKLIKDKRLWLFNSIPEFLESHSGRNLVTIMQNFRKVIFFVCDSSMRFNYANHFLQIFDLAKIRNYTILTDPLLQEKNVFEPLNDKYKFTQILYFPLDVKLVHSDFVSFVSKKLFKEVKIIIPQKIMNQMSNINTNMNIKMLSYDYINFSLNIKIKENLMKNEFQEFILDVRDLNNVSNSSLKYSNELYTNKICLQCSCKKTIFDIQNSNQTFGSLFFYFFVGQKFVFLIPLINKNNLSEYFDKIFWKIVDELKKENIILMKNSKDLKKIKFFSQFHFFKKNILLTITTKKIKIFSENAIEVMIQKMISIINRNFLRIY